jgi:ribulose bisphosphate carboxylase small subunit
MSNVTVSDTTYNVTVSDTTQTVTLTSGSTINVLVDTFTISTSVTNTGSGAEVGKGIVSDDLQLRTITAAAEGDIVVTQNANDISIGLSDNIEVGVIQASGNITSAATITGNNLNFNGTITGSDYNNVSTIDGAGNIIMTPGSGNFVHVNTNLSIGDTTTPQGVQILGSSIGKTSGSATDITFTGKFNGDLTAGTTNISGHLIPVTDDTQDLGSTTKRFRDLYLGPGSLYINNVKVLEDDSGTIKFTTDGTQNINIESGGTLTINNTGDVTSIQEGTINLGKSGDATGTVNVTGILKAPTKIEVGDTDITPGLIHHDATNGNFEVRTNGTGYLHANVADFYVGPINGAVKIDENSIGVTAGTLTVTGNLVGNVTGQVSDLSNKSTSDLSEGSNKYYTDERVDDRVNALLTAGSNITLTYDDAANTLTISSTDTEDNLANNDTDDLAEGSTNQYFTTARARASISASGSLAYNSSTGALTYTQGNTDTVAEGSTNKYYTDERVDDRVNALLTAGSNITLTYDDAANTLTISSTDTEDNLSNNTTSDLAEGSNLYHTTARAISAVEGESTLDLSGAVTITGQLTASDTIKVDDGFIQTSFNPYGAGANMPTTVMGIGQDSGWAAAHIRSRGEHDFGIGSQFNLVPRALLTLSAGRKSGSSDAHLNSGDTFGAVLWNPYSGYRTGTEWLTPSATIYGIATENHSESQGFGTKLEFSTTENTNKAGATALAHTNKSVFLQGHTITTDGTLKIDDDLIVTGDIGNSGSAVDFDDNIKVTGNVASKTTTIGDFDSSGSPAYAMSGIQLDAGDTAWPSVVFKEYAGTDGGGLKPVNLFTNPGFETEVFGGTPASPAALGDGKRILSINGNAANAATLPGLANIRILGQTVGTQSGSNRGSELIFQTTPQNSTNISATLNIKEGNVIRIGNDSYDSGHGIIGASGGDLKLGDRLDTNGNNILNSSGDVTVDDNLQVNDNLTVSDNLTVNGNTVLGNANSDTITCNAKLTAVNGFVNTILTVTVANQLAGFGAIDEGAMAYISDGNAGSKCLAFFDGSAWKKAHAPGDNISSS